MNLTRDGVWKAGVWASTVWASGVWFEGAIPPIPVQPSLPSFFGGTYTSKPPEKPKIPWRGPLNMENQDRADIDSIITMLVKAGIL